MLGAVKHLGLISIIFVWAGLIFLIRKWKGNVSMTFSQHAAQTKAAQIYYFLLFAIELPLFALFMYGWFMPQFDLPVWFGVFFGTAIVAQLVAVIIPETKGRRVAVHRYAAFLMGDCIVPLMLIIALSANFDSFVRVAAWLAVFILIAIIAILLPQKGYHPKALVLQASYFAVFHAVILLATYSV